MVRSRASAPRASQSLCCSFCDKHKDAVAKLIAGPGVYVCDECVRLCYEIITEDPKPDTGSWHDRPDDEMLASLARRQDAVAQMEAGLRDRVATLRARGISWTRIGDALGVSKQAAWERFAGED